MTLEALLGSGVTEKEIDVNLENDVTTGVVDTRGKFAAGVNFTSGQFDVMSLLTAVQLKL
jgi:hypothetical protein